MLQEPVVVVPGACLSILVIVFYEFHPFGLPQNHEFPVQGLETIALYRFLVGLVYGDIVVAAVNNTDSHDPVCLLPLVNKNNTRYDQKHHDKAVGSEASDGARFGGLCPGHGFSRGTAAKAVECVYHENDKPGEQDFCQHL